MFSISWLRSSPRTARPVQRSAILRVEELEIRNTPSGIFSSDPVTRTLVVTGTDPQTLFGFSQSTTATAGGPFTIYTMTMDGTFQQVNSAQVGTIIVNGQGAFNTADCHGLFRFLLRYCREALLFFRNQRLLAQ